MDGSFTTIRTATRPDYQWLRRMRFERRPHERVVAHYELERELAERLRVASRDRRLPMYGAVYDELFAGLPDHPQWTVDPARRAKQAQDQIRLLVPVLHPEVTLVELGCGDAATSFALAPRVGQVIGVDVTDRLVPAERPGNFRVVKTNGIDLPLADRSVDVVFSSQLIEHLHPEDAREQLVEIFRVLKPGGRYLCLTPNRLMGPNDISVFFGYQATGLHMREYDHRSLAALFREIGFGRLRAIGLVRGRRYEVPVPVVGAVEQGLGALPHAARFWLYRRVSALYRLSTVALSGSRPAG